MPRSTATTPTAAINGTTGNIEVTVDNDAGIDTSIADIVTAINDLDDYDATLSTSAGDGTYSGDTETEPTVVTLASGVGTGGLANALVIELGGSDGAEVLSFGANTTLAELVSGINLVSDATGVEATANGTTLELSSSSYGTDAFVDLSVIEDDAAVFADSRQVGTDIVASVSGVSATGDGNILSINTATLDITATITAATTGAVGFTITGGGALFQLGPDVVSNQQARLGIGSVNTARLGGVSGKLYADLASESAALTRSQILVQSGTTVLQFFQLELVIAGLQSSQTALSALQPLAPLGSA